MTTFDRRETWDQARSQDATAEMLYRLLVAIQMELDGPVSQAFLRVELAAAEHLAAIGYRVEKERS